MLLLFFELMSVTSTGWVRYHENPEAEQAGDLYHHLSVVAGVLMGTAVILLHLAGVRPQVGLAAISHTRTLPFIWAVLFLIAAFGIKAGMFPLHIWLPKDHPVAPPPARAHHSVILITTGDYG